jgi:NAD(P)-dependent dehydrogenase (short-subunit alcohol dehydrogenase family)
MYRSVAASIPLGRVAEVEDVASAFQFCLAESFVTGQVITVDGGSVLA